MTIKHATVKTPGQKLFAVEDWNASHTGLDDGTSAGQLAYWSGAKWLAIPAGNLFFNTATGKIGIGTTTPNSTLSIGYSGFVTAGLSSKGSNYGVIGEGSVNAVHGIGGNNGVYGSGTTGVFGTGTTTGVHATGQAYDFYGANAAGKSYFAGKVGIGTNAPLSKLSVGGAGNAGYIIYAEGYNHAIHGKSEAYAIYGEGVGIESTGVYGEGAYGVYGTGSSAGVYAESSSGYALNAYSLYGIAVYANGGTYDIYAGTGINYFYNKVGIGISNPVPKLHVYQSTAEAEIQRLETSDTPVNSVKKVYQGSVQTTTATTATVLTLPLASGKAYQIVAHVIGADPRDEGSEYIGSYSFAGTFYRSSQGTASQVGTTTSLFFHENISNFDSTMVLSGTNVLIRVTSGEAVTLDWTATIEVYETNIGYGF